MLYYLTHSMHSTWLHFFTIISKSSDPVPQILISMLVFGILYLLNNKLEALSCVFNICATGFTNLVLKNIIKKAASLKRQPLKYYLLLPPPPPLLLAGAADRDGALL